VDGVGVGEAAAAVDIAGLLAAKRPPIHEVEEWKKSRATASEMSATESLLFCLMVPSGPP
jgi:hypothetical protein